MSGTIDQLPPGIVGFARGLDRFGRLWNDYELHGAENMPDGPALVVLYHSFFPLDAWYFACRHSLMTGRRFRALGDRFLWKIPGLAEFLTASGAVPGERDAALRMLQEGDLVLVSPGGVREALAGRDDHYKLIWGDRLGFVKVALQAGVPLVPVFTENAEELYRSPGGQARPFKAFYETTRWPVVPILGLGPMPFPVKLTTWIGPPVVPTPGEAPEALRERVRESLQALMDAHQGPRPRLPRALARRVRPPGTPKFW